MREQDSGAKISAYLRDIPTLKCPTPFTNFSEWKADYFGHYSTGFVVAIAINKDNPGETTVYFDGGRRRKTQENEQGIVLEKVNISTRSAIKKSVKVGDLVVTNGYNSILRKLASRQDLEAIDAFVSYSDFSWEAVIGVL